MAKVNKLLRTVLPICVVALVFCAPLFRGLPNLDLENDEAIYSYAAESILDTGDWMNPRSSPTTSAVFLEKPPLKFWIVALPIRLGWLPRNEFGLRFWDAVFGSLAFLYVFSIGRRMAGWLCGAAALVLLYTFDHLIFSHGLRSNTMDAAVVLSYAGGIYHFLRWAEREDRGWGHATAVGAYFFLGFMTKFVAALFLPAVLAAASLELPAVRSRVIRQWRTWLAVGAGVLALVAPWFVYQSLRPGHGVWSVMFAEHVVTRLTSSLDPAHLKPWNYYFVFLLGGLVRQGTIVLVVGGAVLIHLKLLRERWLPGTIVLYWFWLPFAIISFGSSKLWHYAYPFLPPVALAAGYCLDRAAAFITGAFEASADAGLSGRFALTRFLARPVAAIRAPSPWLSRLTLVLGLGALGFVAVGLLHPEWLGVLGPFAHQPYLLAAALAALLFGAGTGRPTWMARIAVPVALLALMPFSDYRAALARTTVEVHPMRSSRDCLSLVARNEQVAGRPVHQMWEHLPAHTFNHSYFYYFRNVRVE